MKLSPANVYERDHGAVLFLSRRVRSPSVMTILDTINAILPVPLSTFGDRAVHAYAGLPGLEDWTPPDGLCSF